MPGGLMSRARQRLLQFVWKEAQRGVGCDGEGRAAPPQHAFGGGRSRRLGRTLCRQPRAVWPEPRASPPVRPAVSLLVPCARSRVWTRSPWAPSSPR